MERNTWNRETCARYIEQISAHMDDALTYPEEAELFHHLETCPHCSQLLDNYRLISQTIKEQEFEPPKTLARDIMAQINKESNIRQLPVRRSPLRRLAAIAAIFAVVAAVGLSGVWGDFFQVNPAPMAEPDRAAAEAFPAVAEAPRRSVYTDGIGARGDMFGYSEETELGEEAAEPEAEEISPLATDFYELGTITETRLLDTYLTWTDRSWETLARALEGAGFSYRLYDNHFSVPDPQNPGSYLYGLLDNDSGTLQVILIGYRLQIDQIDRRIEIRFGPAGKTFHYDVPQTQEGGSSTESRGRLRDFILFG